MDVQILTSPSGINAWHVENYSAPTFALRFAFIGGASQDPPGKAGLTNFLTLMLGEGAGRLTAMEFQKRLENLAIRLAFSPEWDAITGRIEALSETRREVGELARLALTQACFEDEAIERKRRLLLDFQVSGARRPAVLADTQWNAAAFAGHPNEMTIAGSEASVTNITAADLEAYRRRAFTKDRLKVVAVGDITASELKELLDQVFGDLPERSDLEEVAKVSPAAGGRLRVAEMQIPQSIVSFGLGSVRYDSHDFIPAYVLSHIIGGNGIYSRLGSELRTKRGLAFYALAWLERRQHSAIFKGRIITRNDKVGEALDVLREEMRKLTDGQLRQEEIDDAKSYLIGSNSLPLRSNAHTAKELLGHSLYGFGPHFLQSRKSMIAMVTLEQVNKVARESLDPENLIVSIAGTPALQPARRS